MKLRFLAIGLLSLGTVFALSPAMTPVAEAQPYTGGKAQPKKAKPKPKPPARIAAAKPSLIASTNAVKAKRAQGARKLATPRTAARGVTFGGNAVAGQQGSRRWSVDTNRPAAGGGGTSRPSGNGRPPAAGNRRWSTETNRPSRREQVRGTKKVTKGNGSGQGKNKKLKTAKPSPNPSAGSRGSVTSERLTRLRRNRQGRLTENVNSVLPNNAAPQGMAYRALEGSRPRITASTQPPPRAAMSRQTLQVPVDNRPRTVKSARPPG